MIIKVIFIVIKSISRNDKININFMTNKQLTQQQNLDELMKQTLLNILSAKGIIYTYYKNNKLTKGKI
jgi:RNA-binding protein YhbY